MCLYTYAVCVCVCVLYIIDNKLRNLKLFVDINIIDYSIKKYVSGSWLFFLYPSLSLICDDEFHVNIPRDNDVRICKINDSGNPRQITIPIIAGFF